MLESADLNGGAPSARLENDGVISCITAPLGDEVRGDLDASHNGAAPTPINGDGPNRAERRRRQRYSEKMLADLARSKLTADDAKQAGFLELSPDECFKLYGYRHHGYLIRYHGLDGRLTGFWRLKTLDQPREVDGGFTTAAGGVAKPKKTPKYLAPAGESPQLYRPTGFFSWAEIAEATKTAATSRSKVRLYFCESEKAAILAAKLGIKGVNALGGCWAFKAKSAGHYHLVPSFDDFDFRGVEAFVLFDSDARSNPQVKAGVYAFAHELTLRGARVFILLLPHRADGSKSGLDDLLIDQGVEGFRALEEQCVKDGEFGESATLWKLNTTYSLVRQPPSILILKSGALATYDKFTKLLTAKDEVPRLNAKGDKVLVPAGPVWVRWPQGNVHSKLVYEPGMPRDIDNRDEPPLRNLWPGFKWESHPGDISNWQYQMDHLFYNKPDSERVWFERWAAYPIKFPGTKLLTAVLLFGPVTGSGKTLTGRILCGLYGDNATEIGRDSLVGSFNTWAARRQFILCDEIANRKDLRIDSDKLKRMITGETVWINEKFQPAYEVRDGANSMFTSNHYDGIYVVDEDRRFFAEKLERKMDPKRGSAIANWARHEDLGPLMHYFDGLDMGDFNPSAAPPRTADLAEVIDSGRSDLDDWVRDLKADPDTFLKMGNQAYKPRDLFTLDELASACKVSHQSNVSPTALRNALRNAGIERTKDRIATRRGRLRFWIVNHSEKWLSASADEIGKTYDAALPEGAKY